MDNLAPQKNGTLLYGDDFTLEQIKRWYEDESEAYAELGAVDRSNYSYAYHLLNQRFGFKYLPSKQRFGHAVGLGSAYGDEFEPIADRIERLTILEPSTDLRREGRLGTAEVSYQTPNPDGKMTFQSSSVDLFTSLGVLHHIPNVSRILSEIARCLRGGGILVMKEPVVSMGDWTKPRPGLTRHERGLPRRWLLDRLEDNQFDIVSCIDFNSGLCRTFCKKMGLSLYGSSTTINIDRHLSRAGLMFQTYRRSTLLSKLAPASIYIVAKRRQG